MARRVPAPAWTVGYRRAWLRGDLVAGVTITAYLIPQVMAYAEVAGLPAVVGLWAAVGALVAYALLGSSRQLSAGPESSTALMTAAALAALGGSDPDQWPAIAAALALGSGLICLIGRLARLGFLADLLSKPVLIGYMCGIAVLMIVSQLSKVTGIAVHGDTVLGELASFAEQLDQINVPTVVLSVVVICLLAVGHRYFPKLPSTLIVMVF